MKLLLFFLITFLFLGTSCSKEVKKPQICTTTIPEPDSLKLDKKNGENFGKK